MSSRSRTSYGPQNGCSPNPLWENSKGTMNPWEWLYAQLKREFAGDRECFFDFSTCQPRDESASSSKSKCKASGEPLFPFCKVVEAIPQ